MKPIEGKLFLFKLVFITCLLAILCRDTMGGLEGKSTHYVVDTVETGDPSSWSSVGVDNCQTTDK